MSEFRLDRLSSEYILIAPERLHRPDLHTTSTQPQEQKLCPFCEGHEHLTPPEVFALRTNSANSTGWSTRVVPNLYKAVSVEETSKSERAGMSASISGVGAHEVLIESVAHERGIESLGCSHVALWLESIIARIEDLKKDRRLISLSVFKNHGFGAGSTQGHPHTQLIALPLMPKKELAFLAKNMSYYRKNGRGLLQDILEQELKEKTRIIGETGDFVAFCPYASAFPFEVILAPTCNISSLEQCNKADLSNLSELICSSFAQLRARLGAFDFNLYFTLAPMNTNFENEPYMQHLEQNYRFMLRIVPRIFRTAGFELATNVIINPIAPEECARILRNE